MNESSQRRFPQTAVNGHFESSQVAFCPLPVTEYPDFQGSSEGRDISQEPRTVFELITTDGRIITQVQPK